MNMKLPLSDFKWIKKSEFKKINWKNINTEKEYGYILEVDLIYPENLHDFHRDYPLAPFKGKVSSDKLSDYQIKTLNYLKNFGHKRTPTEKLMLTFENKLNYVIHFKTLKLYIELGLEISKIHRVLKFKQENFFKSYIELNTKLRQESKNDFDIALYKLLNNSLFGKTIQDNRKHLNVKIALNENQCRKWIKQPIFEQFHILNENTTLMKLKKSSVKLDKPIYIGFSILDLTKYHMYLLHYKLFKKYYQQNIELIYTDTDSYVYHIKTENIYDELKNVFEKVMDFSNFSKDHELYDNKNNKALGFLKSEYGEKVVNEFVGIKSKLYSIIYNEDSNKRTAKGLQKAVLKKFITHDHYKKVIEENNVFVTSMSRIQSKSHDIHTVRIEKMIFMPMDDKRFILENGIDTLPYGHYAINHQK